MSSSNHTLAYPDISDVMSLLSTMKKQNEEILAKNEEILTKLNAIEDDNQKLRQELHEIKNSLKHQNHNVKVSSRKRDDPEDEAEYENEHSNKKRPRVSGASLPEPELELGQVVVEPPASFNTLDDDCLGNVLDFVGKKSYSVFGRMNKRCHEMFCSKGYPKVTYLYGYGPLHLIQQRRGYYNPRISKGVLHFNRRDILDWMLIDESDAGGYRSLKCLCWDAIEDSRLDIIREAFHRANERQLEFLRNCYNGFDLCATAAKFGKLECLKLLRENECGWNTGTWYWAKQNGHEHILEYLRNNKFPTEWKI